MNKAFRNFSQIVTMKSAMEKDGRKIIYDDLSILETASIIFNDNEIVWVGTDVDFPSSQQIDEEKDFSGHVLLPEVVDPHTHTIFDGDRSREYRMRINGADYTEIAKAGGGILSTMNSTVNSSFEDLYNIAKERLLKMNSYGVGTVEIKAGYALSFEKEKEIHQIIDKLKKDLAPKIKIKNTFLAAHAVPASFKSSEEYMDEVVIPLLKDLGKTSMLDAVDIFHEQGYFNTDDVEKLFNEAKKLNIPVKSHADEFNDNNGAALAVKHGALSVDHLLMTGEKGIESLVNSDTVATLLPGTGFFLGKNQSQARKFLDAGVKVALASDYNPGSCHFDNLLQIAAISAPTLKMNMGELWCAITLNAAHALGIRDQGAIKVGMSPRFSIFKTNNIDKITYNWGENLAVTF
jgi:imidazolonepropionase